VELLGETPNGLSASVTVSRDDRQCQHYFSELRLKLHRRSQLFIGANDETLSVAVRVNNPDRSPFKIQG